MGVYRGHRISLRANEDTHEDIRIVHFVDNPRAFGTYDQVAMMCGATTLPEIAVERITSEPLTCVWCIAGRRRFSPAGLQ